MVWTATEEKQAMPGMDGARGHDSFLSLPPLEVQNGADS